MAQLMTLGAEAARGISESSKRTRALFGGGVGVGDGCQAPRRRRLTSPASTTRRTR